MSSRTFRIIILLGLLLALAPPAGAQAPIEPATDLIESSPRAWKALFAAEPLAGHIVHSYRRHLRDTALRLQAALRLHERNPP